MSLLVDMLSRVKQPGVKRDVPPNLKNIVKSGARQSVHTKKIITLSLIISAFLLSGIFTVYFVNSLTDRKAERIDVASIKEKTMKVREAEAVGNESPVPSQDNKQAVTGGMDRSEEKKESVNIGEESGNMDSGEDALIVQAFNEEENRTERKDRASFSDSVPDEFEAEVVPDRDSEVDISQPSAPDVKHTESQNIDAYLYKARAYEMKRDYSHALASYKKALAIDRDNHIVINNIAYILLQLGRAEESKAYARMAVEINRDYHPAFINLGIAYAREGNLASAEEYLSRAFELDPDNQNALLNLAILYEKQSQLLRASEYFSRLVRLGNVNGSLGLARVYEKEGRLSEALKIYRSLQSLDSVDPAIQKIVRQRIRILVKSAPKRAKS